MENRLMGEELEYGLAGVNEFFVPNFISAINRINDPGLALRTVSDASNNTINWWLTNGGRFYKDTGEHPEYATPECLSAKELVAHDKASEEILRKICRIYAGDNNARISVMKNNTCYSRFNEKELRRGDFWGLHENYLIPADDIQFISQQLAPHLIARIIYTGAGHIMPRANFKCYYLISSRADAIYCIKASGAVSDRPLVLEREEHHVNNTEQWKRIQIVSSEANMLELPIFLKFMTNHLCLRLIESGWHLPQGFELSDPIAQLHLLNNDIYCNRNISLKSGHQLKAVEIEKIYLNAAKELSPLSDEERFGLERWEWVLNLLSQNLMKEENFKSLFGILDWATKWYLIKRELKKNNLRLSDPRMLALNLRYHSLNDSPASSLWSWLIARDQERPFMFHVVSQEDINRAIVIPPPNRAKIRGDIIKMGLDFPAEITVTSVNWAEAAILLKDGTSRVNFDIGNNNPFIKSDQILEQLKKILYNAPNSI